MDILKRITEPSSHAGLAAASQGLKFFWPAGAGILDALTALFAAIAVALPEKGQG